MHADNLRCGALLMLASGLLFSAMGALVKYMSALLGFDRQPRVGLLKKDSCLVVAANDAG